MGVTFCVNYLVLNTITILDQFLIFIVNELLDDLASTIAFSNLTLKSRGITKLI